MSREDAGAPPAPPATAGPAPDRTAGDAVATAGGAAGDDAALEDGAREAGTATRWRTALFPNYGAPDLLLASGQGSWLQDADGRRYLDLLGGIAVAALGHAHPRVVAAICEQAASLGHVSNLYATEPALALAERLQTLAGGHQALLVNSGTEANEAALKTVRRHAHAEGRGDGVVLAFQQGFHGRTLGALALTGQPHYHEGFAPLPGQIVHVPFNDPAAMETAFDTHDVVGVFAEAVQGEGGVTPMARDTAAALQRACRSHGSVLVLDEVQAGMGRTGRFFAHEHLGLQPDIVTMAKALGGGLPLGACLARPELAAHMGPGSHGCTFGGNPIAAAAALATLDVIAEEDLVQRAADLGKALAAALEEAGVAQRGMGLLRGLPVGVGKAAALVRSLRDEGLLVGQAGPGVLRLAPALNIGRDDLLGAVPVIADAVRRVDGPS